MRWAVTSGPKSRDGFLVAAVAFFADFPAVFFFGDFFAFLAGFFAAFFLGDFFAGFFFNFFFAAMVIRSSREGGRSRPPPSR
jgi:hypothetical protein